jgi:hypothetical protein
MTVVGEHGRLGCANHRERDTCTNRRTVLRDQILARVCAGLKDRLLAPELVETFVAEYVAEVNLANRNATSRRSKLETELGRVDRRIRTMVQTIGDTGGSRALVEELRALEHRQDQLREEIVAAGTPEVPCAASQPRPNLSSEGRAVRGGAARSCRVGGRGRGPAIADRRHRRVSGRAAWRGARGNAWRPRRVPSLAR